MRDRVQGRDGRLARGVHGVSARDHRTSQPDTPRGPLGAGLGGGAARVPPFCLAGPVGDRRSSPAPSASWRLRTVWTRTRQRRVRTPTPFRPALVRPAPLFMPWRGAACWDVRFSAVCNNSSSEARRPR